MPVKLFHYTSRDAALEHILPSGRLRFGRLPRTNDPREFAPVLPGIAGFVGDDDEVTTGNPFEFIEEANELLRGSVHVLCFTEDRPSRVSSGRYGNGPCRARMWAQYAGNHTGVCLVFDGDRLDRAALDQFKSTPERSLIRGPVTYAEEGEYPHLTLIQPEAERDLRAFVESMVERNPRELFFTKDWDWASETEYRLLLRGETKDEEFLKVRDALEAVIVGQRFHPVYKPGVYKLCEELEVEALEIQWQMGPPVVVRMLDPRDRRLTDPAI
jgi:hypothetical protein